MEQLASRLAHEGFPLIDIYIHSFASCSATFTLAGTVNSEVSVPYPVLNDYLTRLSGPSHGPATVSLNPAGQAQGRFFDCMLTSAFRPIDAVGGSGPLGFEALVRAVSEPSADHSLWRMLDHAASDEESVELDRLCRMLHAINFFRQAAAAHADLYLSVHDRLLSAVSSNHGYAFRRILGALGLPVARIVLQLPAASASRRWLVNYVADNYRRNGFRLALNVNTPDEAFSVLAMVRPDVVKIDSGAFHDARELERVLVLADARSAKLIATRVEVPATLSMLERASAATGVPVYAQGKLIGAPQAVLPDSASCHNGARAPEASSSSSTYVSMSVSRT
jgi:EAL domain-containing protein (putative c-di-GMP-specific phosphodiesterase class I)